jgi:ribosomal protein S10
MKILIIGTVILTPFLLIQGCDSQVKTTVKTNQVSQQQPASNPHKHDSASNSKSVNPQQVSNNNQNQQTHKQHLQTSSTKAKLIIPKEIKSTQAVPLAINIQDKTGKPVSNFDTFQEKQMHLIVVSDDLRFFQHVHPIHKGNGRFEVNPDFPSSGSYTLFSDYKPAGQKEQVSAQKIVIPGNVPLPTELEKFSNTKILADTKVNLKLPEKTLKAGKEVKISFDLQELKQIQPIKDLQPYLGEKGHLVIVKSSSPLTDSDYVHAHALKESSNGQINFISTLPSKGTYKVWLQFNRNGKVNTADFWLNAI